MKKMIWKKSMYILLSALLVLYSATCSASAYDDNVKAEPTGTVSVVNRTKSMNIDMVRQIEKGVSVAVKDENGIYHPVDCTVIVSEFPQERNALLDGNRYKMDVSAQNIKVKSNSKDYNHGDTNCSLYLTMEWNDGPGTENSIERLSGNIKMVKGTYYGGQVYWGADANDVYDYKNLSNRQKSFDFDPDYDNWSLSATYRVNLNEEVGYDAYVTVTPTIFD